eukprot:355305-Chlamydomonas_euryale.AAC.2
MYNYQTRTWTEVQMGTRPPCSNCLRRIVSVKLTNCRRLETLCEHCGTTSLKLWSVFDCSLAWSVAEDGRVEQLNFRQGRKNIEDFSRMYSSAICGRRQVGSGGHTPFRDFLKLTGCTKLITRPDIGALATERTLDSQACREATEPVAPLQFKKPQQVERMTRTSAGRGGSSHCCATFLVCDQ